MYYRTSVDDAFVCAAFSTPYPFVGYLGMGEIENTDVTEYSHVSRDTLGGL
jgi:hypothetical protein